jgi:hypothetical protein
MNLLIGFEFNEEGIEDFQKLVCCRCIGCCRCCWIVLWMNIEDWRYRETEEEVIRCPAREFCGREVGKSGEVWPGEMNGIKPKDTAFVAVKLSAQDEHDECTDCNGVKRTPF